MRQFIDICESAITDEQARVEAVEAFNRIQQYLNLVADDPTMEKEDGGRENFMRVLYKSDALGGSLTLAKRFLFDDLIIIFTPRHGGLNQSKDKNLEVGAAFGTIADGRGAIALPVLISPSDPKFLNTRFGSMKKTFVHEYMHYLAWKHDQRGQTSVSAVEDNDLEKYYNNNEETNAYFQEAAHEVEDTMRVWIENMEHEPIRKMLHKYLIMSDRDLVDYVRSQASADFLNHLTPENKRRFDKRAYRFVRETLRPKLVAAFAGDDAVMEEIALREDAATLTLYHGSSSDDPRFEIGHTGNNSHTFGSYNSKRYGIFLTDNPDFAAIYGNVKQYVVKANSTFDFNNSIHVRSAEEVFLNYVDDTGVPDDIKHAARYTRHEWEWFEDDLGRFFVGWLGENGYDSATFTEYNTDDAGVEQKSNTFVLLNKYQIRNHSGSQLDLFDGAEDSEPLVEARHPDQMIMFHGTNDWSAREIVKAGGMIADPESKHYGDSDDDDVTLASLPGSYLTNNLKVAVGYAYKSSEAFSMPGGGAIVVAKVDLKSAVPDEDVIRAAFEEALRARDPEDFVERFHKNLVQNRPIPMQRDAMLRLKSAHEAFVESDYEEREEYFSALDDLAHAYAEMVFDTHPVYLGGGDGHHTVRVPKGISLDDIVSVTTFTLDFNEDGEPEITDVAAIHGTPIDIDALEEAAWELFEEGFF